VEAYSGRLCSDWREEVKEVEGEECMILGHVLPTPLYEGWSMYWLRPNHDSSPLTQFNYFPHVAGVQDAGLDSLNPCFKLLWHKLITARKN
jgi:hypothetical protein